MSFFKASSANAKAAFPSGGFAPAQQTRTLARGFLKQHLGSCKRNQLRTLQYTLPFVSQAWSIKA